MGGEDRQNQLPVPPSPPAPGKDLTQALRLIEEFEGCILSAYKDPVGVWTIGYGHTLGVKQGMVITKEHAIQLLGTDVDGFAKQVDALVTVSITTNERCALISFAYNLGAGALKGSTLLKKLNLLYPRTEVAAEFLKWDHAGGRVLAGLTRRREAEKALFLTPDKPQLELT